jgi:hypothetical protein
MTVDEILEKRKSYEYKGDDLWIASLFGAINVLADEIEQLRVKAEEAPSDDAREFLEQLWKDRKPECLLAERDAELVERIIVAVVEEDRMRGWNAQVPEFERIIREAARSTK